MYEHDKTYPVNGYGTVTPAIGVLEQPRKRMRP